MADFTDTRVYINTNKVKNSPAGHTIPTAAIEIGDADIEEEETFQFTAGTYANADEATAFDALIAALETAIEALIETTWGVDTTTKTVDYNAEVISITRGLAPDAIFLAEANDVFIIKVNLSIAIS